MIRKARVAGTYNCFVETDRLLKVTGSHSPTQCGNIFETAQDGDVVTRPRMCSDISLAYRMMLIINFLIIFYSVNTMFYTLYFLVVQIVITILGQGVTILC